jgi:V/A-type H+-transporting ATPase subunit E
MVATRPEEDIESLSRAILKEAQVDADEMKEEARLKADAIRQRAQEDAERARREILDRAQQEADRLRSQSVASAQLKARTMQLEHREKLLDRVFQAAREKLPEIQKRGDYDQLAATLLREALVQLRVNKAQIRADQATRDLLEKKALRDISGELNGEFTLGDPLEEGTGIVVDAGEGRLHYDNTLETRLERLQSTLRASVHKILMGESS